MFVDKLPRPFGRDLSDLLFLTASELDAARDALIEDLRDSELDEPSIQAVLALLLEGGWREAEAR